MGSYMVRRPDAREAEKESRVPAGLASGAEVDSGLALPAAGLPQTDLVDALRRQIHDVIEGRRFFDPYAGDAVCMRALAAIATLQEYFREERPNDTAALLRHLRRVLLDLDESDLSDAKIRCFLAESIRYLETDAATETLEKCGGEEEELSASVRRIPTMLCRETLGYYKWLARTFEGFGDIVELGSWMGSSTACLAEGLAHNPSRGGRRIH